MKLHALVITILTLIKLNYAFYDHYVVDQFFGPGVLNYDLSSADISKSCKSKDKKCLWKCCPKGQIMGIFKTCINMDKAISNVTVYDKSHKPINKSLESIFEVVPELLSDGIFAGNSLWWYKASLREDGKLFIKFPNVYYKWKEIDSNHFCVDMRNGTEIKPVFMVEYKIELHRPPNVYNKWALSISIVFLILTLMVYAIVPQLRNMNGILVMVYICTLILCFIMYAVIESYDSLTLRLSHILTLTLLYYFFKMSSFCWTNVIFYRFLMSREESKEVPVSKELVKYGGYAVGLPLFLTILVATIELSDFSDTPSVVTPQILKKGNFAFHEMESLYYLYVPLMLILAFNWFVCFIKVVEFCKTSRQFAVVAAHNESSENTLNRPMQFVKLLAILSCFFLVEMLTMLYPHATYDTSATFTLCIGGVVMFIFLWNPEVKNHLIEKAKEFQTTASNSNQLVTFFQKK